MIRKEVNAAERANKQAYNNAPPPTLQQPEAAVDVSNEEKDKYRITPQTPAEKKNPSGKADSLKAEYQGMVAARQTGSRAGSVRSQVLSEDEGSDEDAAVAGVAERDIYSAGAHEVNHREVPGPGLPAATSSRAGSAVVDEAGVEALAGELGTLRLSGHAEAQIMQKKTEMTAAPAVALGSTQKMRGFPVKTPGEFEAEAQIPLAPAADEMQRKVQLTASLLKSTRAAFHKVFVLGSWRRAESRPPERLRHWWSWQVPGSFRCQQLWRLRRGDCEDERGDCEDEDSEDEEDLESLLSGSDSEDEEVPLDEMPADVLDQPKRRRTSIIVAAAAVQNNHGVEDFSTRGRVHAGTMEADRCLRVAEGEDVQWAH
ncbi:hypothetical protein CYMTET_24964 [Cymbomonas tetramitiformis]|uniref:Uncharacterized protein n=1 Tax=Cymbomonas tetramitiformis TaxID=36881 RepID=A0AAE0FUS6_9CHLO|nr:hypothetical protein CYMTET_24964 [Cymbomonas tetramitiformis]